MPPLPTAFNIRPMTLADIPDVLEIEKVVFPSTFSAEGYRNELQHNRKATYRVLEEQASIIGYVGYWLIGDEAHISIISIHPDQQRRGLGELLLLFSLATICSAGAVLATLEVRESNLPAQQLYSKYRFDHVGRRKRYYRDTNEDALLMTAAPIDQAYCLFVFEAYSKVVARLSK